MSVVTPVVFNPVSTAAAVANNFLELGRLESEYPAIDQMKLQKLLFYAHAWHLANKERPLFEEDFEAWPWGPIVRDVYNQTRKFGRKPVTEKIYRLTRTESGPLSYSLLYPEITDGDLKDFIRQIWDIHKEFTGIQLSNSTHDPGEPWTIVKESYGSLDSKPTIPNELIMSVFKKKLEVDVQDCSPQRA